MPTSMTMNPAFIKALAPTGSLRVAINTGNSVIAQRDAAGNVQGVSVALGKELAQRLGLAIEYVVFEAAGKVVQALKDEVWDVAFLAIDPLRAEDLSFTPPYVLIEGNYVVREDSPVWQSSAVDQAGMRLALGAGTAYELFLSRHCKAATLERFPTTAIAFEHFLSDGFDATAGVKEVAQKFVASQPGLRLVEDAFMVIEQAIAIPRVRVHALPELEFFMAQFIGAMKANGFVADALKASGQKAAVAP